MIRKLEEIADIQFGPYEKGLSKGSVKYLLSSHFNRNNKLTNFEDSFIELDDKIRKSVLKNNDVILAGKGQRIFAWAYQPSFGTIVPSSLFYIIRTDPNEILGEYLMLFLNTDKIQNKLKIIGAGTSIISIPKKELQQIEIVIPPIKKQKEIVELANLLDKDMELTSQLLNKKHELRKGLINKLIQPTLS